MNKKETMEAVKTLISIYDSRTEADTPADTLKKAAAEMGAEKVRDTLAALVIANADDGRIARDTLTKARAIGSAYAEGEYLPRYADIHRAHLDQLAAYMFAHFDEIRAETTDEPKKADEPAAPRPVYYGQKGRSLVHYWRALNCYKLAERKGTPTAEAVERATALYNKLIRYALADAHQWEWENTSERYANSKQAESDRARLDKRRARLEKELSGYGLRLKNYGLYPSIIDSDDRHEIELVYFD